MLTALSAGVSKGIGTGISASYPRSVEGNLSVEKDLRSCTTAGVRSSMSREALTVGTAFLVDLRLNKVLLRERSFVLGLSSLGSCTASRLRNRVLLRLGGTAPGPGGHGADSW